MSLAAPVPDQLWGSVPVLDASGTETSLDWPEAEYSVSVAGSGGQWHVEHHISGATGITNLINEGSARFVAEARCPRTLFSHLERSDKPSMELHFDESMTWAPVFIVPGVVAIEDCDLSTADAAVIWRRAGPILRVKRGLWLVRGRAVKEDLASSMLLVEVVDWLKDHEMSIRPYADQDGNTRLRMCIPAVQEPRLKDRAFVAQAWQAALAYLPSCEAFSLDPEHSTDNFFARELEAKLSGIPLWSHEEKADWDPLRAATRLVGMPTPAPQED